MNALQDEDLINTGTRVDLLENKVVLAVPEGNPADIQSFEDIGTDPCKRIALGNEDVPVGSYSVEILTNLGILDELESGNKITYGSTSRKSPPRSRKLLPTAASSTRPTRSLPVWKRWTRLPLRSAARSSTPLR